MKKIFTTLVAALMLSAHVFAVSSKDVCGQFSGTLYIDWDEYPGRSVYLLPGAVENSVTFVLPDFTFGAGKLGNIVLPNIQVNADGTLNLEPSTLYLDSIDLRASIRMLNNYEEGDETFNSVVSATQAEITLEIAEPQTLPMPIIVYFSGEAVRNNNYAMVNGGFEGAWTNNEPKGWHSFGSATGVMVDFVKENTFQFVQSTDVRPGSAGSHSALISSTLLLGVKANGNCTNGQINAGSMTADDKTANYNFSDPANEGFNTPLQGRPDSIVFWAKYQPADRNAANEENRARMSAIITTDDRYQDPEEADNYGEVKIATAVVNYAAAADFGWQRIAVPFTYNPTNLNKKPAYILTTFTTNKLPGGGSSYTEGSGRNKVNHLDSVYLDDVKLVYNNDLARFAINEDVLSFENKIASVDENYCDSCDAYNAVGNGISTQTFIAFDAVHKCIFVYVIADDFAQSGKFQLYRVNFTDTDEEGLVDPSDGLEKVGAEKANVQKVFINGQLIIRRGNELYTITGKRIQ